MTLFDDHLRLVDLIVGDMLRTGPYDDSEDMTQDGRLALWQCTERWDPTCGAFARFARRRIRGAVIDGVRDRTHYRRVGRADVRFESINEHADLPRQVAATEPGPEQVVIGRERLDQVAAWLDGQDTITLAALNAGPEFGFLLADVADRFALTESRISQIRAGARDQLRELDAA